MTRKTLSSSITAAIVGQTQAATMYWITKQWSKMLIGATLAVMALAMPVHGALIDGLVANWQMNGDYTDATGNHDGSAPTVGDPNVNTPTFETGQLGDAVRFDRTPVTGTPAQGEYVLVPDNDSLDFGATTDFTISFWYKMTNTGTYQSIVSKRSSAAPTAKGYMVAAVSNKLRLYLSDGSNAVTVDSTTAAYSSEWRQCVVTVDRDGLAQIYLDGLADGAAVNVSAVGNVDNTSGLTMGTIGTATGGWMNGTLDEVGIWNRVLTSDEIAALQTHNRQKR